MRTQCETISLDAVSSRLSSPVRRNWNFLMCHTIGARSRTTPLRYLRFEHQYPASKDISIGIHSSHRFQEIRLFGFIPGIEQTWSSADSENRGDIQANKDGSRTVPVDTEITISRDEQYACTLSADHGIRRLRSCGPHLFE